MTLGQPTAGLVEKLAEKRGHSAVFGRDEAGAGDVQPVDDLGEVGERTGQPVDPVNLGLVDKTRLDIRQQSRQCTEMFFGGGETGTLLL